ncbi:MAG: hypothetical protein AB8H86_21390 [Polyangiales bacterium]
MTKPLVMALLMSGCVFGAETDVVGAGNQLVRINRVQSETDQGMQPLRDATFLPDFETGANELLFGGEGWNGAIRFEDLAWTVQNGGTENLSIERDGNAEVQRVAITSDVEPFFSTVGTTRFDRRATLTFVTFIENRAVEVVVELDLAVGYDC